VVFSPSKATDLRSLNSCSTFYFQAEEEPVRCFEPTFTREWLSRSFRVLHITNPSMTMRSPSPDYFSQVDDLDDEILSAFVLPPGDTSSNANVKSVEVAQAVDTKQDEELDDSGESCMFFTS
jgi:hypothetical protein